MKLILIPHYGLERVGDKVALHKNTEQACLAGISAWQTSGNGSMIVITAGVALSKWKSAWIGFLMQGFIQSHNPKVNLSVGTASAVVLSEEIGAMVCIVKSHYLRTRPRVSGIILVSAVDDAATKKRVLKKALSIENLNDLPVEVFTFDPIVPLDNVFIKCLKRLFGR